MEAVVAGSGFPTLEEPGTLSVTMAVTFLVEYPEGEAHAEPDVGGMTQGVEVGTVAAVPRLDVSANPTIPVLYSVNQAPPRVESILTLVGFAMDVRDGSVYSV